MTVHMFQKRESYKKDLVYIKKKLYSMIYDSLFNSLFTFISVVSNLKYLNECIHPILRIFISILILLNNLLHTLNLPNPKYCWGVGILQRVHLQNN